MLLQVFTLILAAAGCGYCILLVYLRARAGSCCRERSENTPGVSVIIPARNEEAHLPALFASLLAQTYPTEKREVIFINDRSGDSSGTLLEQFCKKHPHCRCLETDPGPPAAAGKKQALIQGIDAARYDIILTTDADCTHQPAWIETMVSCFTDDVDMVLGYAPYRTDSRYGTLFHKMLALDYLAMGTVSLCSAAAGYPVTAFGANLAYRKSVFNNIGGFGSSVSYISGDDDLMVHRFAACAEGEVVFNCDPRSAVFNPPPLTFRDFFRQRLRFSSKHFAYPPVMLAVMAFIYLFNLLLAAALAGALAHNALFVPAAGVLLLKTAADLLFLQKGRELLKERPLLRFYPAAALPHIFYVVLIPLLARLCRPRW